MGILTKLFGRSKPRPNEDTGARAIREMVDLAIANLHDDQRQNRMLPPLVRDLIVSGVDCDQLPGGSGQFGRDVTNPIPSMGRSVRRCIFPG